MWCADENSRTDQRVFRDVGGLLFRTATWFLPKFLNSFFGIMFESCSDSVKTSSGAWHSMDRQKHYCCKALILLPEEVLMTLWPLILSLFFLSRAVHQTSSVFFSVLWRNANTWRFQLTHSHCVWGARRIHKLCSPCCTVKYFWDALWQISAAHLLMNDLPVGNWLPAWRLISLGGISKLTDSLFERWHEDKWEQLYCGEWCITDIILP